MSKFTRARSIAFPVQVSKETVEEHRRIKAAMSALEKELSGLLAEAAKHPDIATAARLANYNASPVIVPDWGQRWMVRLTVSEFVEEPENASAPRNPYVAPLNLAPQTVNLLLNSKILSD